MKNSLLFEFRRFSLLQILSLVFLAVFLLAYFLKVNEIQNTYFFPADDRKPQFLVDISQLITVDEKTGIQRVVRSLITEFLANPPANWDVKLVYSDRFSLGYRYATKFSKQFSQQATE